MRSLDLFSEKSDLYAAARPSYPDDLLTFIAAHAPSLECVWDCGTGNGQAAVALSKWFSQVQATDLSAEQIRNAASAPHVHYSVQSAEFTHFADDSFDAVCVAQALHWFNHATFYAEVYRVLKPNGIFAAFGYSWSSITPEIDAVVASEILQPLAPYWAAQNQLLWDHYRTIAFPFDEVRAPSFAIELQWTLTEYLDYVGTWSATRQCLAQRGADYFAPARQRLQQVWGEPQQHRLVRMPLALRIGRRRASLAG